MAKISIFGLGYVGSVTAACLTAKGHQIIGIDADKDKVATLDAGNTPVLEPQVQELVTQAKQKGLLSATTNVEQAIAQTDISFISVGTPSLRNGKLDLGAIEKVCRQMGAVLARKNSFHSIVVRSTILPGTTNSVVVPILESESGKRAGKDFSVCFNPEFLREGTAVSDFFAPTMTILGSDHPQTLEPIQELYQWVPGKLFITSAVNAEMVKYVCNAFHALKVAFANEVGTLCNYLSVDAAEVMDIFCADDKLNVSKAYLRPGFAFGGSCLPKDLRALTYKAKELDLRIPLLDSILPSNIEHIERAVEAVLATGKRKIGILGLSFKPGTDDLRESPMVHMVKRLLGEGCEIRIWDSHVTLGQLIGSNRRFILDAIPHIGSLLREDIREVVGHADLLVIATREIPPDAMLAAGEHQLIFNVATLELPQQVLAFATAAGV